MNTDTVSVTPPYTYPRRDTIQYNLDYLNPRLKGVTMTYRSAIKNGYVNSGKWFGCRQSYNKRFEGLVAWQNEMINIINYVKQNRANGIDTVAVVHGYDHPNPDIVATYIYTRGGVK